MFSVRSVVRLYTEKRQTSLNTPSRKTPKAPCLAIFGTGSDVGKSVITTALCRFFAKLGFRVAPFKAQNMSNNSGVTPEGLEMGRAQIVQAEAAGIPPHVDMNPILLKPTGEKGAQIVLMGKVLEDSTAGEYHQKREYLFSRTCEALDRLRERYELVVIEGAGSCAEVNLMETDIVNLRTAEHADAPVILAGDIHRGGIFAQLIGTLACLPPSQGARIAGFIINRFRGDITLFEDGIRWIEETSQKQVFGVLPWYSHFTIEAEDSVVIENPIQVYPGRNENPAVAVIRLPHISNFTDFDPLTAVDGLDVFFIEKPQMISGFQAVILPGSKNTRFDLNWLLEKGWFEKLRSYALEGGHILGICGGFQIMGRWIHDPQGLEGTPGSSEGLGLLPVETVLKAPKTTTLTTFAWQNIEGTGYEIHMGQSKREGESEFCNVISRNGVACDDGDGCISAEARMIGTYIHGLFDTPRITKQWLGTIGLGDLSVPSTYGPKAREEDYDQLAAHFERYIDTDKIVQLIETE